MQKRKLQNYAKLIAQTGVNIQKGQDVMIYAELDQPEFVAMVAQECYKLKARKVIIQWDYQPMTKVHIKGGSKKALSTLEEWEIARLQHRVDTLPCMIYLLSEDPDGLNGINQQKYAEVMQAKSKVIKPFRDKMDNKYQWCIAAVPGVAWAKKLFPNLSKKQAVEKLWQVILETSRADIDPIKQWDEHNKEIHSRCDYLNSLNLVSLHYTSSNGTNLTVGLIEGSRFAGASEHTISGIEFNPNIPSEEVFTSPDKSKTNGIVYSSLPLSWQGQLIDEFWIKFNDGRVIDCGAKKNEELLKQLVNMDEGSHYLGECALVPYDSPIRNSGILFYNTLFDENAACHLALGEGFPDTINGFENMTIDQCREKGLNSSIIHEDFMIGTKDLEITAKDKNGKEIQIFKNGNWAIEI